MGKRTSLYDAHVAAGAKLVDFAGWDMPVHYGSQIDEHHAVRKDAGVFDVSHMTVIDIEGGHTRDFLSFLLANDVGKLKTPGRALYTCMLNSNGGVIDDLIVYYLRDDWFRLVVNAATRDKDIDWIDKHSEPFDLDVTERSDLAMLAVQGPNAREKAIAAMGANGDARALKKFNATLVDSMFVARTGYTGEDGFEIVLPSGSAPAFWRKLLEAGVSPVGLGARDTLRLEAGLNLYGSDMDETTSPYASNLGWTIALEPDSRDFIGRNALNEQRAAGVDEKLAGLVLMSRGVLRDHQKVIVNGGRDGVITSGTYAPTLDRAIGLARVPRDAAENCEVEIRGKRLPAKIVKPPFVRDGKPLVEL